MSNIIDSIQLSGVTYTIQGSGGGGNPTVELTQAEYDALVESGAVQTNTYYIITDAQAGDLTQYWTSAQTQSAITSATSGKVDTSTFETYSGSVETALTGKQDTLSAGTGISIVDNVISATGGGGGGKAVSGGTNISITTGETADTINCTIPFKDNNDSLLFGYNITLGPGTYNSLGISPKYSNSSTQTKIDGGNAIAIGAGVTISGGTSRRGEYSVAIGNDSKVYGVQSTALGIGCNASGNATLAIGRYSTSKGNTSVAIGNQANVSGDSSVAIGSGAKADGVDYKMNLNNQIKVTPSNQVYISNSANTSTYCLQEKIENTEAALGGLSLVKLTQAEYDALVTKDSNTLYIVTDS